MIPREVHKSAVPFPPTGLADMSSPGPSMPVVSVFEGGSLDHGIHNRGEIERMNELELNPTRGNTI
jgi:hypothetical protein